MQSQKTTIAINEAWPCHLFMCEWGDHAKHAPGIVSHINELAAGYDEPIASGIAKSAKPASGLVESPLNLFNTSHDADMVALRDWIANCVRAAVSKVNGDEVPPSRLKTEFTESWFHVTNKGGFHDAHTHGNCSWCGIYYVVAGDAQEVKAGGNNVAGNGINRFYAPISSGGIVRDYGNQYLGRGYLDIQPMAGRMVIFPSYLLHSALPYVGDTDRVIVSFNSRTTITPQN